LRENSSPIPWPCILLLLITGLCSCTAISKKIDAERTLDERSFILSETHYREVIGKIGPPSKLSKYNDGLVFLYESIDIKERQLGLNFNYNIFRWLKFSYARGVAERETLLLIFGRDGYLIAKNYKEFKENLGSGQAVSFLVSIESLVDSSSLEEEPASLTWGSSLLKPLPETLNYPQNLGTGKSGIQQLGAPGSVGQHSLELAD
jgi:hypothetical protein